MNKYKDYIARTQQDRMMIDMLAALESINELLKVKEVKTPVVAPVIEVALPKINDIVPSKPVDKVVTPKPAKPKQTRGKK